MEAGSGVEELAPVPERAGIYGRKRHILLGVAGAVFVLDVLSKLWVRAAVPRGQRLPLLGEGLAVTHYANSGTALGLLPESSRVLVLSAAIVAFFVLGTLFWFMPRAHGVRLIGGALALGGAAGNLLDRLRPQGGVVDFLEVSVGGRVSPVFNLADIAIVIGAFLLLSSIWWDERRYLAGGKREAPGSG